MAPAPHWVSKQRWLEKSNFSIVWTIHGFVTFAIPVQIRSIRAWICLFFLFFFQVVLSTTSSVVFLVARISSNSFLHRSPNIWISYIQNQYYTRVLISSSQWSIRGQTHRWRHHYKHFALLLYKTSRLHFAMRLYSIRPDKTWKMW